MHAGQDGHQATALFAMHRELKAKIVPFGGWLMPVSYTSVLQEHKAVREACGLFDVSHMGELIVSGPWAAEFLQQTTINDVRRLRDGYGQYSAMLHPTGGMVDDIIVYRLDERHYFICVNASNSDKDYACFESSRLMVSGVELTNDSANWSQLAVQGPTSLRAVAALLRPNDQEKLRALRYMQITSIQLWGKESLLARTGYTGELGFEIYMPHEVVQRAWQTLLSTKEETGIAPIGLGARDTLRLEACFLLYGNEMNDGVSPLEAGIAWATRLDKGSFIGRDALIKQKELGLSRLIFGFRMTDDGIPRHDMDVYKDGQHVGKVTSGSVLPTVGGAGGMALLNPQQVAVGDHVEVDVRGKRRCARIVKRPLYEGRVKS